MNENVMQGVLSFLSGGVVLAFIEWVRYRRKDTAEARERDILNGNLVYGHWETAYNDAKELYIEMKNKNEQLEQAMCDLKQKLDDVYDKYHLVTRENRKLKEEIIIKDEIIAKKDSIILNFEERLKKLEEDRK